MTGHHHEDESRHVTDWGHVARLERELFGETYHHEVPGCDCDACVRRRLSWDADLHAQNAYGFTIQSGEWARARGEMSEDRDTVRP